MKKRLEEGTVSEILNKVYVKKGDILVVPAGVIHAIGAGILICEIQDSSEAVYRLYDYNRKDSNGRKRKLDIDQGLKVMTYSKYTITQLRQEYNGDYFGMEYLIKEISVRKYKCISNNQRTFFVVIILEGKGKIVVGEDYSKKNCEKLCTAGETFFIPALNGIISLYGDIKLLLVGIL